MKQISRFLSFAAAAAMCFSACSPEELKNDNVDVKKYVTVHFGAENTDPTSTKATLTPNEGETAFQAMWENGDVLSVEYISPTTATNKIIQATWDAENKMFSAELPNETGAWDFSACYPVPNASNNSVDFGSDRTQKGNAYNSKYDIMIGTKSTTNSAAGKDDDGSAIVFPMTRQTAIAYFHFTSDLDEAITKATLTVGGEGAAIASNYAYVSDFAWAAAEDCQSITITFPEEAPNAQDFQLWFNVLETAYESMSLTVETANKTFTISKATDGVYEKGKLYKVKKAVSWTDKAENPSILFFYESFDKNVSTGGNDASWGGGIATGTLAADNTGWTFVKGSGANMCAKFGTGSAIGSATSPSLGITTSEATLWFKAGSWKDDTAKTLVISIDGNGTVKPTEITLSNAKWTEYFCTISGADADTKVKISAKTETKNRFFLDEVYVYSGSQPIAKANQYISFDETSFNITIDKDFTAPILSGAKTTVTYTSDNESVATVEASTGAVTIIGAGTAKITATAMETEEYRSAIATYSITVSKLSQTLSFEKPTYSVNINDIASFVSPTVTGASTKVSYSILLSAETSDGAITINSTSGELTINSTGEATITAVAEESDIYYLATASYTIKVLDSSSSSVKWVLVSDLANLTEGTYILASVKTANTWRYMPNTTSSSSNPTLKELTTPTDDNTIADENVSSDMKWDLVSTGKDNEYYIRPNGNSDIGLGCTNQTGKNIRISSSYKNMKWGFSTSSTANWQIKNDATTAMYLAVYADDAWRNYNKEDTNQNGKFYIFKQVSE